MVEDAGAVLSWRPPPTQRLLPEGVPRLVLDAADERAAWRPCRRRRRPTPISAGRCWPTTSPTSSTPRAPPAPPRASRSPIATWSGCSPPRSDGSGSAPDDVWALFHSYAFDFSVWELWGALLAGGRLVIVPRETTRDPAAFIDLFARERVTRF